MDRLPRLGKRELICLLLFTCNYVVSVWRGFLFLWMLGMGYVILLWHSLSLPYNHFHRYIDRLGNWARKWGMRFQPVKCNMMQLTRKHLNKIQSSYTLEGAVLENVNNIKYLGVTITNRLKRNTHISSICTKAYTTLGFLRRTLFSSPQNVKEAAYKGMVRPILEYGSSIWHPHTDKLQEELEKVQNRASRFVTRNYVYETGSMTGILGQLKWERKGERIIDSYCYTKV